MISRFRADNTGIVEATDLVRRYLSDNKIRSREITRASLIVEEGLGSLVSHIPEGQTDTEISVKIRNLLGRISIELSADGEEFFIGDDLTRITLDDDVGRDTQERIRNLVLKSFAEDIRYSNHNGTNRIRMTIVRNRNMVLYLTLMALVLSLITGILLSNFAGEGVKSALGTYVLSPVVTMYMNMLRMLVAPIVFISIVSAVSNFTNASELGKIGGRILTLYLITTFIAVGVGIGSFYLWRPGSAGAVQGLAGAAAGAQSVEPLNKTLLDTLVNIVPSDIISPFRDSNMPQLIFLSVVVGLATGAIGKYSAILRSIIDSLNELVMHIVSFVIKLMPVIVYCSIVSIILKVGFTVLLSLTGIFATYVFGIICMMMIYMILLAIIGRTNPFKFFRQYAPAMMTTFALASSNASLPVNLEAAKKMGIRSRIYSLSLPLGSTINMDGTCIQISVFALALAGIYGVEVPASSLVTLALTIIIMSIGMPGIPGSGLICMTIVLAQIGVPTEAVALPMAIAPLIGMFLSMSNCTGDMVVTRIVDLKTK